MPTLRCPDPRELLSAFLVLRLGLLSEQQWLREIKAWCADQSSFAERLRRQTSLAPHQVAAVEQLADSLLEDTQKVDQHLARYTPPDHLLSTLLEEPTWQEWLPRFFSSAQTVAVHSTVDAASGDLSGDFLDAGDRQTDDPAATITSPDSQVPASLRDRVADDLLASQRYEPLRVHAEGGLGRVSIAEDKELGRTVALKQIKEKYASAESSRRRFIFEAEVTGQLEHPGIIPVYSLASDEVGNPFYTMRFVDGETLGDAIKRYHRSLSVVPHNKRQTENPVPDDSQPEAQAAFEFRRLLNRFVDLCNAVDYAHHRGFIHRDLKPNNVMLGQFGETLVVDWGLARRVGSALEEADDDQASDDEDSIAGVTQPGAVVGTPAYMSPEQAAGKTDELNASSDIYSLGSILYTILTGKRAYPDADTSRVLANVREGHFRPPRDVSKEIPRPLNAICLKAMSHAPGQRYASARELADDIDRWLADEPVSVRTRRWMKRHRVAVASSVVGLLIATVSLGVILAVQRRANEQLLQANTKERAATAEAEQQFDLAMSAIENYHDDVASDFLLGQAEFQELRESLLQAAQSFYADLTKRLEEKADPSRRQRESLYDAQIQLAGLADDMGDYSESLQTYRKAEAMLDGLLSDFPGDASFAEDKVRIFSSLAHLYRTIGQPEQAEQLLEQAGDVVERIVPSEPVSQNMKLLRADYLAQLATHYHAQSQPDKAIGYYEQVLAIRREIAAAEPDNVTAQRSLAKLLNDYGTQLSNIGKNREAEAVTREGAELQEQIVQANPNEAYDLYYLASSYTNLAYLLQDDNRMQEAIHVYESSEPIFRSLTAKGANIAVFRSGLASTLNNLGLLHASLNNFDKAEAYYREALQIKERLVQDHPLAISDRVSLGGSYSNFGGFQRRTGKNELAMDWFDRSIEILTAVLNEDPNHATARFFRGQALINRARTLRDLQRYREAAADFEAAAQQTTSGEQQTALINQQAQTLAQSGLHQDAVQIAGQQEAGAKTDSDYFNLAFIYALAVASAEQDASLGEPERNETAADYTARAVAALRAMYATGVVPKDVFQNLLNANEFLKPLHGREAFEELKKSFDH